MFALYILLILRVRVLFDVGAPGYALPEGRSHAPGQVLRGSEQRVHALQASSDLSFSFLWDLPFIHVISFAFLIPLKDFRCLVRGISILLTTLISSIWYRYR